MEEEITLHEKIEAKRAEMKEKYADIINDLATKYEKDLGVGFDMLCAIPRAVELGEEPLYTTELEYNADELMKDWKELEALSAESIEE